MLRTPAPQPTTRSTPSPPPRRPRSVALHDNQARRKEHPRDVETKSGTVLDLAAVDPVKAARRCQADISTMYSGFHKEMRRHIADAYAIACGLENDPQAWSKFLEDPFWEKRKKKPTFDDQNDPLLHVMVFVFNAIDRNRYKRASKYATALRQYWRDYVPAQEVGAKIKEDGGIEALGRAATGNAPKKAKPQQSLLTLVPGSEAVRRRLEALQVGEKARSIFKRVSSKRGVTLMILSVDRSKT
jgi:hypothetical protein